MVDTDLSGIAIVVLGMILVAAVIAPLANQTTGQFQAGGSFTANGLVKDPSFESQSSCCSSPWNSVTLGFYNPNGSSTTCGAGCTTTIVSGGAFDGNKYLHKIEVGLNNDESTAQDLSSSSPATDGNALSFAYRNHHLTCPTVSHPFNYCLSNVSIDWSSTGASTHVFTYVFLAVNQAQAGDACGSSDQCINDASACFNVISATFCRTTIKNLYTSANTFFTAKGDTITGIIGIFAESTCFSSTNCGTGWGADFDLIQLGTIGAANQNMTSSPGLASGTELLPLGLGFIGLGLPLYFISRRQEGQV